MTKLVTALLQLPVFSQDAMHGADRAEINAFIDRARSVAQRHPVHAPARGGPGKARLAACADTAKPAAHLGRGRQQLSRRCHPTPERRSSVLLLDLDVRNRVA